MKKLVYFFYKKYKCVPFIVHKEGHTLNRNIVRAHHIPFESHAIKTRTYRYKNGHACRQAGMHYYFPPILESITYTQGTSSLYT